MPRRSGAVQIYKHNLVENSRELLLSQEGITAPPALSARGDLLAAATTNTEKPQLLLYALPSGERIELPLDRQPATLLFWDATGEGVYFLATENGKTSLYYASLKKYLPSLAGTQERPGEEGSQNKDQQEEMAQDEAGQLFDLVIRNGTVIDPETETVKFNYNVGIKGAGRRDHPKRFTAPKRSTPPGCWSPFHYILSYSPMMGTGLGGGDGHQQRSYTTIDFPVGSDTPKGR